MNRISELRKKAGLSQSELGEALGVSQQTISKYERSGVYVPSDVLSKMATIFKAPMEFILNAEGEVETKEDDTRIETMKLYESLSQYNRETWIILGKRLLGGQIHDYKNIIEDK